MMTCFDFARDVQHPVVYARSSPSTASDDQLSSLVVQHTLLLRPIHRPVHCAARHWHVVPHPAHPPVHPAGVADHSRP